MGLPLFVVPVEPEVAAKAAEKVASGRRSSIRRQRGTRAPRIRHENRLRYLEDLATPGRPYGLQFSGLEMQQVGHSEAELPSTSSLQSRESRARRNFELERMRLRDTLSFENQGVSNTDADGPLMPPVPESRDYTRSEELQIGAQRLSQVRIGIRQDIRHSLRRLARRIQPAPTPPYAEGDIAFMSRTGTSLRSPRRLSSFTPTLPISDLPSTGESEPTTGPESEFSFTAHRPYVRDESLRSSLADRVQELNRASSNMERSRRLLRLGGFDGLGDRDRSLSPEGGAAWETLLTSITPDPQPPSVGSSFASDSASAAAAASSSSNSGLTSASTSMTSLEQEDSPAANDCDISDSGSNAEDEEEDIYELQDYNPQTRGDRFWRTYADVVTERADRAAQNGISPDPEHLGSMHRIISRLAEQDDIPDEWWASAGLSRNLRREPTI